MTYTLKNGTDVPIIVARFEDQDTFTVEPGGTHETESYRLALSAPDHGLTVSKADVDAAHDQEQQRQVREDAGHYVEPSPAGVNVTGPAFTPPTAQDIPGLKGRALDDALTGLGLSKSGTVEEKRARLSEHLGAPAGDQGDDDPTDGLSDDEVAESLAALGVEVDDDADADALREVLRERLAAND